jgi:hypothetical protein
MRIGAFILCLFVSVAAWADVSPAEYLQLRPKPQFKPAHTLPRLGWLATGALPETLKIEMATNWFYVVPWDDAYPWSIQALTNATTEQYRFAELARDYPETYKLQVGVYRYMFHSEFYTNFFITPSAGLFLTNSAGEFVNNDSTTWTDQFDYTKTKFISPEATAADWEAITDQQIEWLRIINSNTPVEYIIHIGENGMGTPGNELTGWLKDPRVQAGTNGLSTFMYASYQKGRELGFITKKINQHLPDRELFTYYGTGFEGLRYVHPDLGLTFWTNATALNGFSSDIMNTNTDYPSFEMYFDGSMRFTNASDAVNSNNKDLLVRYLNAIGYNFNIGYSNNYTWTCGGWTMADSNRLAEITRYTGFLKCLYTGGMVGAIPGYYATSTNTEPTIFGINGFSGSFPTNIVPHWLQQIEASSRVHAQFTWLEDWLFNATLISGPQKHFMSTDQPAYEFTNTVADATCRVMARKHNDRNEWLVTAWAAHGDARNVTVNIPDLGDITIEAAPEGNLYRATSSSSVRLLNELGEPADRKQLRVVNAYLP